MVSGDTRRNVLKSLAAGTAGGITAYATTNSAGASGASFSDGVNLQPSYKCAGEQGLGWERMGQHSDIGTVRIEYDPDGWASLSQAKRWIEEAAGIGYDIIVTYHKASANGSSNKQDLMDAADWWVSNYGYLSRNASFTINLMNEWGGHDVDTWTYADAYSDAIGRLRDSEYGGPVVCDCPGWGQNPQVAADAAPEIGEDVIFSVHVYASAHNARTGDWLKKADLDYLNDAGYPCIVGEFGSRREGQADWSGLVDHAKWLGWPVIGWAWNGDGSDWPMNMVGPYWGDNCNPESYWETEYFWDIYDKLDSGGGGGDPVSEPTNLYESDVGQYHVTVVWDHVDGTDTYRLYYKDLDSGWDNDAWVSGQNYASATDLTPGRTYRLWVGSVVDGEVAAWSTAIDVTAAGGGIQDGATYVIRNVHSGKALDVAGISGNDGANVHQWDYLGQANQHWTVESVGGGYYRLVATHSGKILDVARGAYDDGANVQQWEYSNGDNQHWAIEDAGEGYRIIASHSAKALDNGWSADNGGNVHQWEYYENSNQHWTFEQV